jgi:hypothetical protein
MADRDLDTFLHQCKISKTSGASRHPSSFHGVGRIFQLFQNHIIARQTAWTKELYRTAYQSMRLVSTWDTDDVWVGVHDIDNTCERFYKPEPVFVNLLRSPPGHIGWRNRYLGSINVYIYGFCRVCPKTFVWAAEFVHSGTNLQWLKEKNNTANCSSPLSSLAYGLSM